MTVREMMKCCTSSVWITLDEDPITGELGVLVKDAVDAEDVLSDRILNHEVHLMHCEDDIIAISLFTKNDAKGEK